MTMKRFALLAPLLAGILWGMAGPFVRLLSAGGLDNITIFFARVLVGAPILLIALLVYKRELLKINPRHLYVFIPLAIVGLAGLNICYNITINTLSLSLAAVLLDLAPLFVVVFASIFFKERVTKVKVISMALAIFGCVLVSGVLESTGAQVSLKGVLIGVLSAFLYAIYTLLLKKTTQLGYHSLTSTFWVLLIAAIATAPLANWGDLASYVVAAPIKSSLTIVANSLCVSILPGIFFLIALAHADAGTATIIASGGEPTAAMVFGAVFYAEMPNALKIAGLILVIIAIVLLNKGDTNPPKHQE